MTLIGELYDPFKQLAEPNACVVDGIAERGHGKRWTRGAGWHPWIAPDNATRLARMRLRQGRRVWVPRMHLRADGEPGQCSQCGQQRPLWHYRVARVGQHVFDLPVGHGGSGNDCRWCCWRETSDRGLQPHAKPHQPLVCARCYSAEQLWEERSLADDDDRGAIHRYPTPELAAAIAAAAEA